MNRIAGKSFAAFLAAMAFPSMAYARPAVTLVGCDRKAESSFAVITDKGTFDNCRQELYDYKAVLEEEGLGTYIIASDWDSPEDVKAAIMKVAARKPVLEGIVLVGEVPIVMVREAQFMTTAFKMNEKAFPEFESSVPSDRFYDDFDLKFDFVKRDTARNDIFYYRLSEKGSQVLRPDIYSARMKVPGVMEGDRYELMRSYLRKVVAAHREQNTFDNFIYFAGHGYNSDCLTIWRQKPVTFRECFPYAFDRASSCRFLNFRQKDGMKHNLKNELQRAGTDLFVFSEHGAFDTQYINGAKAADDLYSCIDALKRSVAGMYGRYRGTEDEEPFMKEVLDSIYRLPRESVSDSALALYEKLDSAEFSEANIFLDDIMEIRSNPRMIVLNACYNGSFHRNDGYVAGCHVFGPGRCVVAQGNTVNVLQDKWEDELMGYLSIGMRAGMWQREVAYLESHLVGDPTFRFSPHSREEEEMAARLHYDILNRHDEPQVWKDMLDSPHPLLRAAGITHLSYTGDGSCPEAALDLFRKDSSWTVRLHALNALGRFADSHCEEAIILAMDDPYEAVVRTACRFAGAMGGDSFIDPLTNVSGRHPEMARVGFVASGALETVTAGSYADQIAAAADKGLPASKRIGSLRNFRNNRALEAIPYFIGIACDMSDDEEVRTVAAEVLGWYNLSSGRKEIAEAFSAALRNDRKMPQNVRKEMIKTIKRLTWE